MSRSIRTINAAPTSGSQTITQSNNTPGPSSATLRLRAASPQPQSEDPSQHVRWASDVIDNEGLGKKSSKVCCIYHAPHGESDGEDSSSSSDEDSEPDLSRAQKAGKGKGRRRGEGGDNGKGAERERKPSPNAYERAPKPGHAKKAG